MPALLALLAAFFLAVPASAQVVINEINYDPAADPAGDANGDGATSTDDDEFVEILNLGATSVDISEWTLADEVSVRHTFPSGTVLPASGAIVVFGGGTPTGDFGGSEVQTTGTLGLNNGGDTVTLNDGSSDVAVQSYDGSVTDESITRDPDGTGPFVAHSAATGSGGALFSPGTQNDGSSFGGGGAAGMIAVNTSADENNSDGDCSLREAVQAANTNAAVDACAAGIVDGDTITFTNAFFIALSLGELDITDDVVIDATSTGGKVAVDANNASRIFDIDAAGGAGSEQAVAFTALDLLRGNSGAGGSTGPDAGGAVDLKAGSEATFTDVDVMNSVAGVNGGGIHGAENTTILITTSASGSSTISGNEAQGASAGMGGGGVWGAGSTTISGNVLIDDNSATGVSGSGGGVFAFGGTLDITGATISNNSANRAGGGAEVDLGATVTLTDVNFDQNTTGSNPGNGGALHVTAGTVTATGGSATGNTADSEGGGFWNNAGWTMTVDGTTFSGNEAQGAAADNGGGGLFNNGGTLAVMNATITENDATGTSGSGGGIFNGPGGVLTVTGGTISGNTSNRAGGGIEDAGGTFTVTGATVTGNNAGANPGNGGGLHSGGGDGDVIGGEFSGNTAVEGGGLWSSGALNITDGTLIDGNIALSDVDAGTDVFEGGGGLFNQGGTMTVDGATISNNSAVGVGGDGGGGSGGGAFNNGVGTLTISNSAFNGNSSLRAGGGIEVNGGMVDLTNVDFGQNMTGGAPGNGGALHVTSGTVGATGGTVSGNSAAAEGGGFWNNAGWTMTIESVAFTGNTAAGTDASNGGGALFNNGGTMNVSDSDITGNSATMGSGSGGGILNEAEGTLTVMNTTFSSNVAQRAGGGIEDRGGTVMLTDVTLDGNDAGTSPGNGGGLHTGGGTVTVTRSTASNNTAVQGGGLWSSGSLTVDISTVSGNTATFGAGVYNSNGTSLVLTNTTVASNTASDTGGGILDDGANTFELGNSIVGDNSAPTGPDCSGTFTSNGWNVIENTSDCTINGDTATNVNADPQLGPLADNGGPTLTHAPMEGSPAIDIGGTCGPTDQRGVPAPQGQCDAGSVEAGGDDGNLACNVNAPLSFDFDGDGSPTTVMADDFSSTGDEFVGVRHEADSGPPVDLSTCSFVVFDPFEEDITFVLGTTGTVDPDMAYVLATSGGDQPFGQSDVLTDSPGAFALVQGAANVNDDFSTVLGRIVAAVVYDRDRDVFGSVGGGATDAELQAFAEVLAQIGSGAVAGEDDGALDLALVAAPNPLSGTGTVSFGLAEAADVRVAMYDALGREVAVLAEGPYGVGRHTVGLAASSLPAGVYVVRVATDADAQTTRITVVR